MLKEECELGWKNQNKGSGALLESLAYLLRQQRLAGWCSLLSAGVNKTTPRAFWSPFCEIYVSEDEEIVMMQSWDSFAFSWSARLLGEQSQNEARVGWSTCCLPVSPLQPLPVGWLVCLFACVCGFVYGFFNDFCLFVFFSAVLKENPGFQLFRPPELADHAAVGMPKGQAAACGCR